MYILFYKNILYLKSIKGGVTMYRIRAPSEKVLKLIQDNK